MRRDMHSGIVQATATCVPAAHELRVPGQEWPDGLRRFAISLGSQILQTRGVTGWCSSRARGCDCPHTLHRFRDAASTLNGQGQPGQSSANWTLSAIKCVWHNPASQDVTSIAFWSGQRWAVQISSLPVFGLAASLAVNCTGHRAMCAETVTRSREQPASPQRIRRLPGQFRIWAAVGPYPARGAPLYRLLSGTTYHPFSSTRVVRRRDRCRRAR